MEGNVFEALKLMCIGLATVFTVLLIIIFLGKLLVSLVNKIAPEEEQPVAKNAPSAAVDANVANAIALAVQQLTGGKGKVEKIEKI